MSRSSILADSRSVCPLWTCCKTRCSSCVPRLAARLISASMLAVMTVFSGNDLTAVQPQITDSQQHAQSQNQRLRHLSPVAVYNDRPLEWRPERHDTTGYSQPNLPSHNTI